MVAAGGLAVALAAGASGAGQPRFTDVTSDSGAEFIHHPGRTGDGRPGYFMPEIMGSGVALFDQDGDGDLDLYLVQGEGEDRLFENRGPGIRFGDAPGIPATRAYGMGVAAGDADGDGDLDLFRTGFGRDVLLLNSGPDGFQVSDEGTWDDGWSASATFCDYDADGSLDLFVTRYLDYDPGFSCFAATGEQDYCNPTDIPGLPDLLYRNRGDGTFVEVGSETGIAALPARGLGVVCQDFTGDGRPDFYVANDTEANHLWVNQGDGTFGEEALLLGAALSGFGRPEAGMGVEIGDLSGDGVLDILLTHFADETNTVYLAEPGIGFVDGSIDLGLGTLGLRMTGFGVALGDFDHDGILDAVIANGRVARPPGESPRSPFFEQYAEPALVLRGDGDRFRDAGALSPELSQIPVVGRGLAAGDLDADGDLDLVITAADGPARIFENRSAGEGAWLVVEPRLPAGTLDHGATVALQTSAGVRIARANPGVSYLSSGDPRAHFGIPDTTVLQSLSVHWSDGSREVFPVPALDQAVVVVRGGGSPDE